MTKWQGKIVAKEITCDVVIKGEPNLLKRFVDKLSDEIFNPGFRVEEFEILGQDRNWIQVFFITFGVPPTGATLELAKQNPELEFILTFEDEIGESGRYSYIGDLITELEFNSAFAQSFEDLVSSGNLPNYGTIFTAENESELNNKIVEYARSKGFSPEGEINADTAGFAVDWLDENFSQGFGCFETQENDFVFRPWSDEDF